jgi:endonuclease G
MVKMFVSRCISFLPSSRPGLKMMAKISVLVASAFALIVPQSRAQSNASLQMVLGNPSGAVASTSYPSNYLMQKNQFALSYNKSKAEPNWVSWHLGPLDLGSAPRSDSFHADTTLPSGWYQVVTGDYTNSGYDRGHNCPSADRTDTSTNNYATFLMTNIVPQTPDNNQGPWAALEDYCRSLVSAGNQLAIISVPNGNSGSTIAGGKIAVPSYMSKVIVVFPPGSSYSSSSVTTSTLVFLLVIA